MIIPNKKELAALSISLVLIFVPLALPKTTVILERNAIALD